MKDGIVTTVSTSQNHTFSKLNRDSINLIAGLGVEGDAHLGETVKHQTCCDITQKNGQNSRPSRHLAIFNISGI